jgi:peptidoglycan/xylan/chitin deacetylase (PgdA/CDA1 family)
LPEIAREVAAAGHEIGNHTDTHAALWLRSPRFVEDEISRAQIAIQETCEVTPKLFRAPYGVRWFGLRAVQRRYGLLGVMWTVIGGDWRLGAPEIDGRIMRASCNGAIVCLHDGREKRTAPDIGNTIRAVELLLPQLRDAGYQLTTVSKLLEQHLVE